MKKINKVSVIGNCCSGKTTLSRQLSAKLNLPLYHVDSVQYLPNLNWRDPDETRKMLRNLAQQSEWVIDGLGPLNILEERMQSSDLVVVLRPSLTTIYWRLFKRQIQGLFVRRTELPKPCFESTVPRTLSLIKSIWNVHHGLWPQLDRIFKNEKYQNKVVFFSYSSDIDSWLKSH